MIEGDMDMTFRPYTHRSLIDSYMPADIIQALRLPDHVHHARVLVYAEDRRLAWRLLRALKIEPHKPEMLTVAVGEDVDLLASMNLVHSLAVFAINSDTLSSPVVKIVPGATSDIDRVLTVIGMLCRVHGSLHWHAAKDAVIVTDDMVTAAIDAFGYDDVDPGDMRAAISAALQARKL